MKQINLTSIILSLITRGSGGSPPLPPMEEEGGGDEEGGLTDEDWEKVTTPQEICDLLGYELKIEKNNYYITDTENGVEIHIPPYYVTGKGRKYLDMNSTGEQSPELIGNFNETYSLKEVMRIYHEMPDKLKQGAQKVDFKQSEGSVLGRHVWAGSNSHKVVINASAFKKRDGENPLRHTLYHEFAHGLDYRIGDDSYGLSNSKEFLEIARHTGGTTYSNSYSQKTDTYYAETLAEGVGIVGAYRVDPNFKVRVGPKNDSKLITAKEWMEDSRNQELIQYSKKVLSTDYKLRNTQTLK